MRNDPYPQFWRLLVLATMLLATGATGCGSASESVGSPTRRSLSHPASGSATSTTNVTNTSPSHGAGAPSPNSSQPVESMGSRTTPRLGYKTFGPQADDADGRKVAAMVKLYYAAVVADKAARACSLLYTDVAHSVPEDYGESRNDLRGKTCPAVLSKLFAHRDGLPTPDIAAIRVAGVRVNGDEEALALLRFPTAAYGEISLHREGDSWKILQLLGGPLR